MSSGSLFNMNVVAIIRIQYSECSSVDPFLYFFLKNFVLENKISYRHVKLNIAFTRVNQPELKLDIFTKEQKAQFLEVSDLN